MKQYASLNLNSLINFKKLSGSAIRMLLIIIRDAEFPGTWKKSPYSSVNRIQITRELKQAWATELGLSVASVNNNLTELLTSSIMKKEIAGIYQINPNILFKGSATYQESAIEQYD